MDFLKKFSTFAYNTSHHTQQHEANNSAVENQEFTITPALSKASSISCKHSHDPTNYFSPICSRLAASGNNMKSLVFKSLMLIMVLQDVTTVLAKPTKKPTAKPSIAIDKMQPVYELQLAVWPTDVDDIIEAVMPPNNEIPMHTLIEQPVAVMPDMDYTQDDVVSDNFAGDDEDLDVIYDPSSDLWPTIIAEPETTQTDPVVVLENYHHKYGNGSEEYKLVMSNGMVNYQRIDHVLVKGVLKPVQQGYYTVPSSSGTRESYQTTYYRADKNGYNVYKTEKSARNPAYDIYLQYTKDQDAKFQ